MKSISDIIEILRESIDAASLCNVDASVKIVKGGLSWLSYTGKMVGIARTVKCRNDIKTVYEAINTCGKGDVLVIDGEGGDLALAGELFITELKRREAAGIIVDGTIRDTESVKKINFPVYYKSVNPKAGSKCGNGQIQGKVSIGGVVVEPGDIIIGDMDGVVAIGPSLDTKLLNAATNLCQFENEVLIKLQSGLPLEELINI